MQCIFCDIISRKAKAEVLFEDSDFLAFLPTDQISKGHTLLVPRVHVESIIDIQDETLGKLIVIAKKLVSDLVKRHHATGVNILHASGKDAQQSVPHLHLHIVPRYSNDGLDLWLKNKL